MGVGDILAYIHDEEGNKTGRLRCEIKKTFNLQLSLYT